MELKVVGKASLKRGFRFFRARNQKNISNSVLEAVTKENGSGRGVVSCTEEDGVVRMKFVMKKSELKQLIQVMNGGNGEAYYSPSSVPSLLAEQRLNLLRKKHISRANAGKGNRHKCWSPALQSIPEEL